MLDAVGVTDTDTKLVSKPPVPMNSALKLLP